MRRRELGPVHLVHTSQPSYRTNCAPGWGTGVYYPGGEQFSALSRVEVMEDEESPPPPTRFKPCKHVSLKCDWPTFTGRHATGHRYIDNNINGTVDYDMDTAKWYAASGTMTHVLSNMGDGSEDLSFTHDDFWRLSHAWESIKPSIEPKLDILVMLAEIDELPKLALSLREKLAVLFTGDSTTRTIARLVDGLKAVKRKKGKGGLFKAIVDEGLTSVSGEWLEYNFALAPTVADLMGILNSIFTFRKELEDLIKGAGKPQKISKSFTTTDEWAPKEIFHNECARYPHCYATNKCPYHSDGDFKTCTGQRYQKLYPGGVTTRIGMTVYYRYSLPDYIVGLEGSIRALCSSLGLRPGLGTIWELIPFSFVIDWLLPIGSILERAKADPCPVKTEILDICFSKREEINFLIQGRTNTCAYNKDTTIVSGKQVRYLRVVGPEYLTMIPSFRWPKWFQLSLGAALAKSLTHR